MKSPQAGAFCSLHHDRSRSYYARKHKQGKCHNTAIACLAAADAT